MIGSNAADLEPGVPINLTALLDVMVNLLFFLMLGSASQIQEIDIDPHLQLPVSTAEAPPRGALQIEITDRAVRVDHAFVVAHADDRAGGASGPGGAIGSAGGDGRIEPLYRQLALWRQQHEARAHSQDDVVVLLCDEGVAYGLLHQVMQTAAEAGFVRFRMATRSP